MLKNFLFIFILFIILLLEIYAKKKKYKVLYNIRILTRSMLFMLILLYIYGDLECIREDDVKEIVQQMIVVSTVLIGIIFAGISILFSVINNKNIKKEYRFNFLDKFFNKAFLCIITSIIVIIIYFLDLFHLKIFNNFHINFFKLDVYVFSLSLFYFIWCIWEFYKLIFSSKDKI